MAPDLRYKYEGERKYGAKKMNGKRKKNKMRHLPEKTSLIDVRLRPRNHAICSGSKHLLKLGGNTKSSTEPGSGPPKATTQYLEDRQQAQKCRSQKLAGRVPFPRGR